MPLNEGTWQAVSRSGRLGALMTMQQLQAAMREGQVPYGCAAQRVEDGLWLSVRPDWLPAPHDLEWQVSGGRGLFWSRPAVFCLQTFSLAVCTPK